MRLVSLISLIATIAILLIASCTGVELLKIYDMVLMQVGKVDSYSTKVNIGNNVVEVYVLPAGVYETTDSALIFTSTQISNNLILAYILHDEFVNKQEPTVYVAYGGTNQYTFYTTKYIYDDSVINVFSETFSEYGIKVVTYLGSSNELHVRIYNSTTNTLLIDHVVTMNYSPLTSNTGWLFAKWLINVEEYEDKVIYYLIPLIYLPKQVEHEVNYEEYSPLIKHYPSFYIYYGSENIKGIEIDAKANIFIDYDFEQVKAWYVGVNKLLINYVTLPDARNVDYGYINESLVLCLNNTCGSEANVHTEFSLSEQINDTAYMYRSSKSSIYSAGEVLVSVGDKPFGLLSLNLNIDNYCAKMEMFNIYGTPEFGAELSNDLKPITLTFYHFPQGREFRIFYVIASEPLIKIIYYRTPMFDITGVEVSKTWVYPGSTTRVYVHVKNVGAVTGTVDIYVGSNYAGSLTINPGEEQVLTYDYSASSVEGTYNVEVKAIAGGVTHDVEYFTLYVYYPLFKITRVLYGGESVTEISDVNGGESITVNVEVCNDKTGGNVRIDVFRNDVKIAYSNTVNVPRESCTQIPVAFTVHESFEKIEYVFKAFDIVENRYDSQFSIFIQPGLPKFTIESYTSPNCTTFLNCYVLPHSPFTLRVTVRNVGYSGGDALIRVYMMEGNVWKLVKEESIFVDKDSVTSRSIIVQTPSFDVNAGREVKYNVTIYNPYSMKIDSSDVFTVNVYPPYFEIIDYEVEKIVLNNTKFTTCVKVRNRWTGYDAVVKFYIEGNLQDQKTVYVDHGEEKTVCLSGTAPRTIGKYETKIVVFDPFENVDDSEVTGTLRVEMVPTFKIVNVEPDVVKVDYGSSFIISVTVENVGSEGDAFVKLIDHIGEVQDQEIVHLITNEKKTIDLRGVAPGSGTPPFEYRVVVEKKIGEDVYRDDEYVVTVVTYSYVPLITIEKAWADPGTVAPTSSFEIHAIVRNVGNGTAKYVTFVETPQYSSCMCLKDCNGSINPGSAIEVIYNCTAPPGKGKYTYVFIARELNTGLESSKNVEVEVTEAVTITIPWYAFLIIVVIVAVVIYAYMKKKTKATVSTSKTAGTKTKSTRVRR